MDLFRLIAEFISLIARRLMRRKYVPSYVVAREADVSTLPRSPRIIRSSAEMEQVFGKPQSLPEREHESA